jgi:glycosyltransferase involved in cell wall biosynthesis
MSVIVPPNADRNHWIGTIDSAADRSARAPVTVIVAARDEAAGIAATLEGIALALPGAVVWVADDGSRDATPQLAAAAGAHVVRSEHPIGKGAAMSAAARAALAETAAAGAAPGVVVLCDGDLGASAARLGALGRAVTAGGADLAVAAFARRQGGGLGVLVGFARWAIRRRCGLSTRAPLSGQRALAAGALPALLPFAEGFGMELAMTIDAVRAGMAVLEVELDLEHRATGRTPAGFAHRGRQLADVARAYRARALGRAGESRLTGDAG